MVDIEDCLFPRCIVVVIREALVALGDEAIGTHLRKAGGETGLATAPPPPPQSTQRLIVCVGRGRSFWVRSLEVWVQAPGCTHSHARCPHGDVPRRPTPNGPGTRRAVSPGPPAPAGQPHLVTELEGSEQQEGPRSGAIYPPVGSVQGLRPQKSAKRPPKCQQAARPRGPPPPPHPCASAPTCSSCSGWRPGAAAGTCPAAPCPGRLPAAFSCGRAARSGPAPHLIW